MTPAPVVVIVPAVIKIPAMLEALVAVVAGESPFITILPPPALKAADVREMPCKVEVVSASAKPVPLSAVPPPRVILPPLLVIPEPLLKTIAPPVSAELAFKMVFNAPDEELMVLLAATMILELA